MADENKNVNADAKAEKKRIKEERKKLQKEHKEQRKEVKKKAKELSAQANELDEEDAGGIPVFLITLLIVLIWLAILGVMIKLNVGGIGSNVLTPLLKDVPVINQILPSSDAADTGDVTDSYGGYTNLQDAVDQIKSLEIQLEQAQSDKQSSDDEVTQLKAEVSRLQTFEDQQTEFERIKTEFYNEVVYADNGPGEEAYQKYYESMDPDTAEYLYQQVVQDEQVDSQIEDYVSAYSSMKAADAAGIFDTMTDDLSLVAQILENMDADSRGDILGAMTPDTAAQVTKLMNPDS